MKRWLVRGVFAGIALTMGGGLAHGSSSRREAFDLLTSTTSHSSVEWRIDRPNPRAPSTEYRAIALTPGDVVTLDAGGCVQTGGQGRSWKRYIDPLGSKAEKAYSALVDIPGTTIGMQRLQLWLKKPMPITRATTLTLGYEDDDYRDNGYSGHDNGNYDQCRNVGPAWVTVRVERDPSHYTAAAAEIASPRYNEVTQRSSHNSYASSKPSLSAQLESSGIRSLELDIHHSRLGVEAPANDFFVYHNAIFSPRSTCPTFSACLAELRAWHDRHPEHEPTTIFVDLKDPWIARHSGASLERQVRARLPGIALTPVALVEACPGASTIRDALKTCRWPTIDALRGKFLFVLTGDGQQLDAYAGSPARAAQRMAFIAPQIADEGEIARHQNAAFFNLDSDHFTTGRAVWTQGFVSRVYYRNTPLDIRGINDAKNWRKAESSQIHHIATDLVSTPNRLVTAMNDTRWPFACMFRDCRASLTYR